jgi:hypothetical protein
VAYLWRGLLLVLLRRFTEFGTYSEPTIRFHGASEAGWRAMGICLAYGLPVLALRRVWYVLDANEPTGPDWEIVFRERVT